MVVNINKSETICAFKDIKVGEIFFISDKCYMKILQTSCNGVDANALSLSSYTTVYIDKDEFVKTPKIASLNITM